MKIGTFDTADRVLVVAEIGNNHEGDAAQAARLVDLAAEAGADAVKFQTFRTAHYVSRADAARYERLERFELSPNDFASLAARARSKGLLFISTPFDLESVRVLEPLVDAFKIASGDNVFYPLLARVAATGKPIIISSGLTDVDTIRRTVEYVHARQASERRESVAVLHCVTAYPVAAGEVNLRAIPTLAAALECVVGYSDHTEGIDAVAPAVALGARIVEKHFTSSKIYSTFRDHALSADPSDLRELVRRVRMTEAMLGDGNKRLQPIETGVVQALRRSIVAAADLPAGHVLCDGDITWVRPAGGLPPGEEHQLIGKSLLHGVRFGDRLEVDDVSDPRS